jgi:glucose-6-phosphate dehydrogenase assembly protein OpcA
VTYDAFVLLASPRMTNLVEQLEQQADIVLIAGSTISSFAHSLFMASRVGGVILLAEAGKTRRKALASAAQSLRSVEAHVIGAILQKSPQERFSGATLRRVRAGRSGGEFAAVGPNEIERALQQRGAENRERRADAQEFPWPLE